jgi:hypothetical protein
MSRTISIPGDLQVNIAAAVASQRGGRVLFVRKLDGSLKACSATDLAVAPEPTFGGGACTVFPAAAPLYTLTFTDTDGHSSQVTIDPSGLAKRQD